MQKLVFRNADGTEIDLTSGAFGITEWEGFSSVDLNLQTQQVPFYDGSVYLDGLLGEREISVTLAMQDNNNLERRYELRRQLISVLNPKLGEGILIYTNDYISKRIKAVPQVPVFENHNSNDSGTPKASLSWTCPSPYWEDLEETEVELNVGERVEINNNGEISVPVKIEFPSGVKNPSIVNLTKEKLLSLQYLCKDKVFIDTNIGEKKIYGGNINLELVEGGYVNDLLYIGNYEYILVGTSIWIYNELTEILEVISEVENDLKKVIYENNIYVAIGDNGTIQTSTDGRHWSSKETGTTETLNSIIFAENQFIVAGGSYMASAGHLSNSAGVILVSSDGNEWTDITPQAISNFAMSQIIYIENIGYYASGMIATTSPYGSTIKINQGEIRFSTDLENWTVKKQNLPTSSRIVNTTIVGIAFGNGKYCAIASNNEGYLVGLKILTSDNGTSWTTTQTLTNSYGKSIMFENETFAIMRSDKNIMISTDVVDWTTKEAQADILVFSKTQNKYFNTGKNIYFSSDLDSWNLMKKIGLERTVYETISFQNKVIGIVLDGVCITEDGENWEYTNLNYTQSSYITCINGVIILSGGNKIFTSTDGENWEEQSIDTSIGKIIFVNGVYVSSSQRKFFTSEDLITWEEVSELDTSFSDWIYSEACQLYVIVGSDGMIKTSSDLINWTSQTSGETGNLYNVFYVNSLLVVFGNGYDVVLVSSDGVVWNKQNNGMAHTWGSFNRIRYINNLYIIVGNEKVYISLDCLNWEEINPYTTGTINDIAYINKYVFVGAVLVLSKEDDNNLISFLTEDSDMNFYLEQGQNIIKYLCENNGIAKLKYRQKYIGV